MTLSRGNAPTHPLIALALALFVSVATALAVSDVTTIGTVIGLAAGAFTYGGLRNARTLGAWFRALVIVLIGQMVLGLTVMLILLYTAPAV
jgi:hypothetical protein